MFVDEAKIRVKAGNGGNGCVSLHREKFRPKGGPDGGDGGKGGDVIFIVDHNMHTLMDLRFQQLFKAENGRPGSGNNRTGRSGEDLVIHVPPGTIVKDAETGRIVTDMISGRHVVAKGGEGGKGNSNFASSRNQAPRYATEGKPGEKRTFILELKLIADVGLVGLPNAGKSTILSRVSSAKPKIAGYQFTTKKPNLGIVKLDLARNFVLADIPGIIKGAAKGKGLGHKFLRHIERTKLLIYVIDCSIDPERHFETIKKELNDYSKVLASRDFIILLNKIDILQGDMKEVVEEMFSDYEVVFTSGVTGEGLHEFVHKAYEKLFHPEESWQKS